MARLTPHESGIAAQDFFSASDRLDTRKDGVVDLKNDPAVFAKSAIHYAGTIGVACGKRYPDRSSCSQSAFGHGNREGSTLRSLVQPIVDMAADLRTQDQVKRFLADDEKVMAIKDSVADFYRLAGIRENIDCLAGVVSARDLALIAGLGALLKIGR